MNNKELTVDQVVFNRLANEIGVLRAKLTQAEVFNEALVAKLKEAEEELAKHEQGVGEDKPEEGE